jgi:hypothetical protein
MYPSYPPPRAPAARSLAAVLGGLLIALCLAEPAAAATSWRTIGEVVSAGTVRVTGMGAPFTYHRLDEELPAIFTLRGPRRLKVVSRYLFAPEDPSPSEFTLVVRLDGAEVLRKRFTARVREELALAGDAGAAVSSLERAYVDVGTGRHEIQVLAETPGAGRVAARFFRESRKPQTNYVAFAPEEYGEVLSLQFASGTQSTYYNLDNAHPLGFTVQGPTMLKIYTRLDFDHTMSGSQSYALEVLRDGESWKSFHYQTEKISSAAYVGRPEVLPGGRKLMRIPVPKGLHRFEIRCLRPATCGVATQIRIPAADLVRSP